MGISLNPSTILSGQGIDVSSIVQQIISGKAGQLSVWQQQQTALATENGLLEGIDNNLTSLQSSVQALADPTGALFAQAANSSQPSILSASAQSDAVPGTHQVVVNSLASAGTLYTDPVAAGADASILPAGSTGGDIQLQVGGASGAIDDIPITPGVNDTLNTLASYINAQSAANHWGITASVVSDANGSRLALFSQNTGSNGALAVIANAATGTLTTADVADPDASILTAGQTSGDLNLQIGGASGPVEDIPITAGSNDTLNTLASYINTQSAANNWGVAAAVVSDGGGFHLTITSSDTGPAGALALTANTNTVLTAEPNPPTALIFEAPLGGANASFTLDGVPFSSASNTVTGAIQGVTLNLLSQAPGTQVELSVGPDTNQITSTVNNFITAYNNLITTINSQYNVDPTGSIPAPPLEGDISLRALQSSILSDVSYAIGGNSGIVNLASLGINMNNDGTLTLGETPGGQSLSQIVASNPSAVQDFFQNASATGFANNFNTDLANLTDTTQGPLYVDLAQNQAEQQDLTTSINNFETQLAAEQTQLTNQYNAVNASLESYPLLLQAITETLGSLDANSSTSTSGVTTPTLTSGL